MSQTASQLIGSRPREKYTQRPERKDIPIRDVNKFARPRKSSRCHLQPKSLEMERKRLMSGKFQARFTVELGLGTSKLNWSTWKLVPNVESIRGVATNIRQTLLPLQSRSSQAIKSRSDHVPHPTKRLLASGVILGRDERYYEKGATLLSQTSETGELPTE